MLVIPAVDILNGNCVRLRGGDYAAVRHYDDNPANAAKRFFDAGATRLHVVDLDAAKSGTPTNTAAIEQLLAAALPYRAQVQIGGGLRTADAVRTILSAGASFAVLGTAAVRDAALRQELITTYPEQIFIGMDSRNQQIAVAGWLEDSGIQETDFLNELAKNPPAAIIRTDISKDGMLSGVNAAEAATIAALAPCPLIVSGGVATADDIRALAKTGEVAAVIVGQALYSGALSFADALAAAA